ncbi:MAG: TonB-dependent receptor [Desulfobacteraceae bacterium]|nr:TonB-dependent receptor [Desulfobacteraceae bacterium]
MALSERLSFRLLPLFILLGVLFATSVECCAACGEWLGRVVSAQGTVQVRKAGELRWVDAGIDDILCPGDSLRVLENSRAAVLLRNETVMRLDQNSTLTLSGVDKANTVEVDFVSGIALFFSRFPFSLRLFTPFVNANVEGTEFLVNVGRNETLLSVFEGRVKAYNDVGTLVLGRGESAVASAGGPPVVKVVARPADAVHWALYYPPLPVGAIEELAASEKGPRADAIRKSIEAYKAGDLSRAFSALPREDGAGSPVFLAYRAFLLLAVGRVSEASSDLAKALEINPQDGYALSLQAVIEVASGKKDKGLQLAKRAVSSDPTSSFTLIALSYAQQAGFDLKGALASAQRAADANPGDALAWARLAELHLSFGYLDRALDAARRAVEISPGMSRSQTVLGYAHLVRVDLDESRKAFREAIRLDQADPLPRLGLGLALIRGGDLKAGRIEIEIAAMLDPLNALIRSYLGKAFYEEKDDRKAAAELSRAKELDPLDPTPWFYDAIRKQTVNRPAEALADLQKSITLNDNRAVYRSRLLLDEDLAARSVSLGRIYNDLGFDWLAIIEGSKSIERDPANFSAHRFLADSFFSLPRHDIARVSELLQAQLLQPINIMPIQPQLAESNRFLLAGSGPRDPGYNEYTPLFTQNRLALLVDGVAGERGTIGEDVVQSGVLGKFSYSLGQFHLQTDGFRQFDDQSHNIYDGFAQVSPSPKTSLQVEYRHKDFEIGDITHLFFDPIRFWDQREKDKRDMVRFGYHHAFAPGSDLIGSFMYQKSSFEYLAPDFGLSTESDSYGFELQHLYRAERFNLTAGAGYFSVTEATEFADFPEMEARNRHNNFYLYSRWNYPGDFVWTFGVSADLFKNRSSNDERNQANPKFGVTWTPLPGTTLRAAAFRTLKRMLITDQTIEPTQVAGFNQFFDDGDGTDAWRYGIGLDQKLSDKIFAGIEYSKRDLNMPVQSVLFPFDMVRVDGNEQLGRVYLYWVPHPWFAIGPEYQYELTKFPPEFPANQLSRLETQRIGLGIGFYHPSGFLARVRPTFVHQEGDFRVYPLDPVHSGTSDFCVLDASIGYRLPKRCGLIEVVARNLFDEGFYFQDTDPKNQSLAPRRFVGARWTLSF